MIARLRSIFRREPLPDNRLMALPVSGDGAEVSFVALTEKQARVCRDALFVCRINNWPLDAEELFDFSETMAFLHRRLSPQYGGDSARLTAEVDQARAALYEAAGKGQQT